LVLPVAATQVDEQGEDFMVEVSGRGTEDSVPCRLNFRSEDISVAERLLRSLHVSHPETLGEYGLSSEEWPAILAATIERMRGSAAANEKEKRRFVQAVLQFCVARGAISSWTFVGGSNRQDYRVELLDGTLVAIEAKGCPDGNNTNIWDRPSWAEEFIVWSLCPSGAKHPAKGVWSGVATRLLPKLAAEKKVVDAFLFWDGSCGTTKRPCPKIYGVDGLRREATDQTGEPGREDWVPPPCVYLMPRSAPTVPNNRTPPTHTIQSSRFVPALLRAFGVPDEAMPRYVHSAKIEARGSAEGMEIRISGVSRGWPDGKDRTFIKRPEWKTIDREN